MRIRELLYEKAIDLNGAASTKTEAIDNLVELMSYTGNLQDKAAYREGVMKREEEGSTGIGEGIAIPHAKVSAVIKPALAVMRVDNGVDYDSLDGEPAKLFFMIAAPADGADLHLAALARLSKMLMDDQFRVNLMDASKVDEFLKIIDQKEKELEHTEMQKESGSEKKTAFPILAITACPTGIAHTYMAAESLENKGKEMGYPVKAETQGAEGSKNVLTREEIKEAKCIIIAADKNVDMSRFDGKRVIVTKVADGIHKPEELIQKGLSGEVDIYHHTQGGDSEEVSKDGIAHSVYKHLMNGVSHMLPFVIGGGILIALAFLFDDYSIDPSNFGKNTPLAAYLKTIGEFSFGMML